MNFHNPFACQPSRVDSILFAPMDNSCGAAKSKLGMTGGNGKLVRRTRTRFRTQGLSRWIAAGTICATLALSLLAAPPAHAENQVAAPQSGDKAAAGRKELQKAIIASFPRPSLDTYPVEFSVGGIHYHVPRNYLTTMTDWNGGPQALVTITIELPDLKPLSKETAACFKPADHPPGCRPFSFRIEPGGGPSADQVFERYRQLIHSQIPLPGPSGSEKYEIGPPNALTEIYKKKEGGETRLYWCHFEGDRLDRDGLCQADTDRMSTGARIGFFFPPRDLASIFEIDAKLRKLTEGFAVEGRQRK